MKGKSCNRTSGCRRGSGTETRGDTDNQSRGWESNLTDPKHSQRHSLDICSWTLTADKGRIVVKKKKRRKEVSFVLSDLTVGGKAMPGAGF